MTESALVVRVPEAEPLVAPLRAKHDAAAAAGMPAHITLLFPFKPPEDIDAGVLDGLRQCFAGFAPFRFRLAETRRFVAPDPVLYLAPEPAGMFRALTMAIWQRHPEMPPYRGRHPDIVPHLCVARLSDRKQLEQVARDLAPAAAAGLPIQATATEVALVDTRSGRWRTRTMLRLGSTKRSSD